MEEKEDVTAVSSHLCGIRRSLGQEVVCVRVTLGRVTLGLFRVTVPQAEVQKNTGIQDQGAACLLK